MPCPAVPNGPTTTSHVKKGDIHWFDANSPYSNISSNKARPFIIIGRNNHRSTRVIISPLQDITNYQENGQLKYPYHAALHKNKYSFLDKDSVILLDQIYTIPKEELWEEWYMGSIKEDRFLS